MQRHHHWFMSFVLLVLIQAGASGSAGAMPNTINSSDLDDPIALFGPPADPLCPTNTDHDKVFNITGGSNEVQYADPRWSKDGDVLLFRRIYNGKHSIQKYTNCIRAEILPESSSYTYGDVQFSPIDNTKFVYKKMEYIDDMGYGAWKFSIWFAALDESSSPTKISGDFYLNAYTYTDVYNDGLSWSPDGKTLFFLGRTLNTDGTLSAAKFKAITLSNLTLTNLGKTNDNTFSALFENDKTIYFSGPDYGDYPCEGETGEQNVICYKDYGGETQAFFTSPSESSEPDLQDLSKNEDYLIYTDYLGEVQYDVIKRKSLSMVKAHTSANADTYLKIAGNSEISVYEAKFAYSDADTTPEYLFYLQCDMEVPLEDINQTIDCKSVGTDFAIFYQPYDALVAKVSGNQTPLTAIQVLNASGYISQLMPSSNGRLAFQKDSKSIAYSNLDMDGDDKADPTDPCPNDGENSCDSDGDYIPNSEDECDNDPFNMCDLDGDDLTGGDDNCDFNYNPDQDDNDRDGIGDACDDDDDDDGIDDDEDACVSHSTQNTDGTDENDDCDTDDDNDGILDESDNCPVLANADQIDTNGDGEGDSCDVDDDGDGVADGEDQCPLDAPEEPIDDGDTIPAECDSCPNAKNSDSDTDGDDIDDACDTEDNDGDNDHIADEQDNCPTVSNLADADGKQADADEDGVGDACDNCVNAANTDQTDADEDTVGDVCDNCAEANPDQADVNTDGIGDKCDDDMDKVADTLDNCPYDANADQANPDGDAFGDACDIDFDGHPYTYKTCGVDGNGVSYSCPDIANGENWAVTNGKDNCQFDYNPDQADTNGVDDGDGKGDACETVTCDDTGDCVDTSCDHDGDGFIDTIEENANSYCTDLVAAHPDQVDNCPSDANGTQVDSNTDGEGDACDTDIDGDGVTNDVDNCDTVKNGPNEADNQSDTNGDGEGNACDTDIDGDGHLNADDSCPSETVPSGVVVDDSGCVDSDNDGNPDVTDLCDNDATDSCDDEDDEDEEDSDGDGIPDLSDNCPTDATNTCDDDDDDDGFSTEDEQIDCSLNPQTTAATQAGATTLFIALMSLPLWLRYRLSRVHDVDNLHTRGAAGGEIAA